MGRLPRRPLGALTAAALTIGALAIVNPFDANAQSRATFAVKLESTTVTAERGGSVLVPVSITRTTSDRSAVSLGVRNPPTGLSVRFNDNPIVRNTNITIRPASSMRNGSYRVSITGSSRGRTSNQTLTIRVVDPGAGGGTDDTLPPIGGAAVTTAPTATTAPTTTTPAVPEFTIVATNPVITAAPGGQASTPITIQRAANFVGPVSIAVEGMPAGGFSNVNPNPITGTQGTLTVVAPPANGNITLTLRSGTRTATVTLQVGTNPGAGSPTASSTTAPTALTDFEIRLAAPAGSVPQGAAGELGISIVRAPGFTAPVTFAMTGQPSGVSVTFGPSNPATGNDARATIAVAAGTPIGSYPLTVTAISGATIKTVPFTLAIVAGTTTPTAPATMTVSPNSITVGQTGSTTVAVTLTNATAAFALQISGSTPLPSGTTAAFSSPSTTSGSTLTITTANAPTGQYTITVIGQAGATVLSGNFTLIVGATPASDFSFGTIQAVTVARGSSALTAIPVAWTGTPSPITFSTGSLPAGVTSSFPTANPSPTGTTLQVTAAAGASAGTYVIPVIGTAGSITKTSLVSVTVT
jgi:hypothetical protein